MTVELTRKLIFVQWNWIPKRMDFKNEILLSGYDISLKVDKSKCLESSFILALWCVIDSFFVGVARNKLHNRYKDLMSKFNAMRAFAEALRTIDPQPPLPKSPKVSAYQEEEEKGHIQGQN